MLKVSIKLMSALGPDEDKKLGTMLIANDGTGTWTSGNYKYKIFKKGKVKSTWRGGFIKKFPRTRLTAWDLLYRILRDTVGHRNLERR